MPNTTYVPIEELEALLGEATEAAQSLGPQLVKSDVDVDMNINKAVLRLKLKRLAVRGTTVVDAAKLLGVHTTTVRNIYMEPEFKKEVYATLQEAFSDIDASLAVKSASLEEQLQMQALESFNALTEMLQREALTANQKIKIHQDFLDRAEASASKRVNISKPAVQVDAEALARAAQTAREMDESRSKKLRRIG